MSEQPLPSVLDRNVETSSDSVISHYANLDLKKVNQELDDAGIDPEPTIAAVKNLVQAKLANRRK